VSQKISAVQPGGVSELPAVQWNAAWSNYGIATADKDFKWTSAVSDSYCVETRCYETDSETMGDRLYKTVLELAVCYDKLLCVVAQCRYKS
jgi:hypothetical protein